MSRKIIGVTVGTTLPKPDFNQTDPTKGDYIKNKPDFEGLKEQVNAVSGFVGDTAVSEQITKAVSSSAVLYSEAQSLTDEQKAQARKNVAEFQCDWHEVAGYNPPATGPHVLSSIGTPYSTHNFDIEAMTKITSTVLKQYSALGCLHGCVNSLWMNQNSSRNNVATWMGRIVTDFENIQTAGLIEDKLWITVKEIRMDAIDYSYCVYTTSGLYTHSVQFYDRHHVYAGIINYNKTTGAHSIEMPANSFTDESLTKVDYAADAKAVGDAISAVSALVGDTSVSEQIGAALNESAVLYSSAQELTDEQKAQARENIGVDTLLDTKRATYLIQVDYHGDDDSYEIGSDFDWDTMTQRALDGKTDIVCRVFSAEGGSDFSEFALQGIFVEDGYAAFGRVEGREVATLLVNSNGSVTYESNYFAIGDTTLLTVTFTDEGVSSHTPAAIYAHVQNGGKVVFEDGGNYFTLTSCGDKFAEFSSVGFEHAVNSLYIDLNSVVHENATHYLSIDAQNLTEEQKVIVRSNIGAASIDDVGSGGGSVAPIIVTIRDERPSHTADVIIEHLVNGGNAVLLYNDEYLVLDHYADGVVSFVRNNCEEGITTQVDIYNDGTFDEYVRITTTQEYADTKIAAPTFAKVGQTIVVKSVGENGEPIEWECADIAQPDWNQTDETAADYIKNKPDEDDALALVMEMGLVSPISAEDGAIYTDENGVLYSL